MKNTMKFTKEVSVCIVAAALSIVSESSFDTSAYMASSLKLKLSTTNPYYSLQEATRKCREELEQNASSFEKKYKIIKKIQDNQNASPFDRCVEINKRQVERELKRIIAEDEELNRMGGMGMIKNLRNRNAPAPRDRNVPAPRESWIKRNPDAALFLLVLSISAVSLGVSFLLAVLIRADGGPIIVA